MKRTVGPDAMQVEKTLRQMLLKFLRVQARENETEDGL